MVGLALLVKLRVKLVLLEVFVGHLVGFLLFLSALPCLLSEVLIKALGFLMADVSFDGDCVDLGKEVGLVNMRMLVGLG